MVGPSPKKSSKPMILMLAPMTFMSVERWLAKHTDDIDAIPDARVGLAIALAAGLGLYLELMIVRLHSSYFQLFAYFKNVSLLSCFLGLGIGYARGSRRPLATPIVLPLLAAQIVLMSILRFSLLAQFLHNPITEQLALGLAQATAIDTTLFVYAFISVIFIFNALCFVPLGHLASRLMMRQSKLISYSWNLLGSLLGIIVFSLLSFMWAPPAIWLIIAALGLMVFLWRDMTISLPSVLAVILLLGFMAAPVQTNRFDTYSPYQILTLILSRNEPPMLQASNEYYQRILDLSEKRVLNDQKLKKSADYYALPYYFKPQPKHVLIVGSGTGNDVAAALRNSAAEVDAVEIDPAILQFGKQLHPESPYQDAHVNAVVDDARAFIRRTEGRYDLIVYGLLDSHTLLAGVSGGIRLDSYVYTVEGLREARQKLKAEGIICLTFSILSESMGRKLYLMLQEAFNGQSPVVYQSGYDGGFTFLDGDGLGSVPASLPSGLREVTDHFAESKIHVDASTDDWPFFYMPARNYPISYILMIVVLLSISIVLVRAPEAGLRSDFSVPCFFLGAGFMLLETKAITELALAYGSTWIVTSVVITAILVMGFLANLTAMRTGSLPPVLYYSLLFLSLIAALGLTFVSLSGVAPWLNQAVMTIMLTLPLFFSGLAFSTELGRSSSVGGALSANLLGAMLGGFLEYNSMYFGFRSLHVLALGLYAFAFLAAMRGGQKPAC